MKALTDAKRAIQAPDVLGRTMTLEKVVFPLSGQSSVVYKVSVNFLVEQPGNWLLCVDAKTDDARVATIQAATDLYGADGPDAAHQLLATAPA